MTAEAAGSTAGRPQAAGAFVAAGLRPVVYTVSILLAVGWTLALGKDLHWDALNYHLYLGFSALNDRFDNDFFAAGPPSYLNPYAYVPLYVMTDAGVPAIIVAIIFAMMHALVLVLTYELTLVAGLSNQIASSRLFGILAVVLAAMNPVFLQQVGSTAIDLSTGVPVLAGWVLLARALRNGDVSMLAIAGALCGIAAALKLSNAVFALAAMPALLFFRGTFSARARAMVVFGFGATIGFALVGLPWGLKLWREFGNPVFPFYNQWFGSPDFTTQPLRYERFMPLSWQAFLTRTFTIASPGGMVQTEGRAPDVRYAVLLVAAVGLGAAAFLRRANTGGALRSTGFDLPKALDGSDRVLAGLTTGFLSAWCVWLLMSGNGRYFLPMSCIAGCLLALVLQRLHVRWKDATITATLVLLVAQGAQLAVATDLERDGLPWQGPFMSVEVPDRFRDEPHLFLSAQFLSGSAFAPYLHPDSGMMNITGFNPLGPAHPGGTRAQALIERNASRLRVLVPLPRGFVPGDALPGPVEGLTLHLRRFGLRVDPSDCEYLKVEGNLRGSIRRSTNASSWTTFLACRLVSAPELAVAYAKEVAPIDVILDRVEATCPNLFHPRGPVTEELPHWVRVYNMGSEIQLWIENRNVKYFSPLIGGDPVEIGTVDEWSRGPRPFDCSQRSSPAFGGLLLQ